MAKRYYQLRENLNTNGTIIEIDLDSGIEKRVKSLNYGCGFANLLEYKNRESLYELDLNEAHSLKPELEAEYSLLMPKFMIKLLVSDEGNLKIYRGFFRKIHVSEITQEEAMTKKEESKNWSLMQSWV